MSTVQVTITNENEYAVDEEALIASVKETLAQISLPPVSVDISIVDEAVIARLNETALEQEGATDVLSFPQYEDVAEVRAAATLLAAETAVPLGDIVASYPRARSDARMHGGTAQRQLEFYIRHSIMHLLGFHHE